MEGRQRANQPDREKTVLLLGHPNTAIGTLINRSKETDSLAGSIAGLGTNQLWQPLVSSMGEAKKVGAKRRWQVGRSQRRLD